MTEPYYEDSQVTLYHGNCRSVVTWLDANVLVTDPPYGMAFQSGHRAEKFDKIAGDADPKIRDAALDMWGDRPAAVFGTWRVPRPPSTKQVLVWYKHGLGPGMGDLTNVFGTCHEEVYLLGDWKRREGVARRGSVLVTRSQPMFETERVGHPTPKPVGLMETLIAAAPDGIIADPFAGGGATLLAARNLGRKAIGVELEERYCEIIARRLDQMALDFGEGA